MTRQCEQEAIRAAAQTFESHTRIYDRENFSCRQAYDRYLEYIELGPIKFYNTMKRDADII